MRYNFLRKMFAVSTLAITLSCTRSVYASGTSTVSVVNYVDAKGIISFSSENHTMIVEKPEGYEVYYAFMYEPNEGCYMFNQETKRIVNVDLGDGTSEKTETMDKFTDDISTWCKYTEPVNLDNYLAGDNGMTVYVKSILVSNDGTKSEVRSDTYDFETSEVPVSLNVEYSEDFTTATVRVTAESKDDTTISNANTGESKNGTSAEFTIKKNGNYTFCVTADGCETYKGVSINKIQYGDDTEEETEKYTPLSEDKNPPKIEVINIGKNKGEHSFSVTVSAKDEESNFDYILLPDGRHVELEECDFTIDSNGTWTFRAYDKAGNYSEKSLKVKNIKDTQESDAKEEEDEGFSPVSDNNANNPMYTLPQTGETYKENKFLRVFLYTSLAVAGVAETVIITKKRRKNSKSRGQGK